MSYGRYAYGRRPYAGRLPSGAGKAAFRGVGTLEVDGVVWAAAAIEFTGIGELAFGDPDIVPIEQPPAVAVKISRVGVRV